MRRQCCDNKLKIETMTYINVPIALLQEAKTRPLQWSLVSFCLALKCYSPSSTYILVSEKKMRHDFHLGYAKAHRLLEAILAGHPLFEVHRDRHGRTLITARCLRRLYAGNITLKNGQTSQEMTVVKLKRQKREEINHRAIARELRHLLFLYDICNKTRADELISKGLPLKGATAHAARTTLSVSYLAHATGRSNRTIMRMTKRAEAEREIRVTRFPLIRCCDDLNHVADPARLKLIAIGCAGFCRNCNDYTLLPYDLRHRFQHIIYGHRRRLTHNIVVSADKPMSQTDLHALFD